MELRSFFPLVLALAALLTSSSCLKTRAQLKDGGEEATTSRPVPNPVQDVQPQGQYAIDELKSELTRINGRIEDLERAQKQSANANAGTTASKDELRKLETRTAELEQAQINIIEAVKKLQEAPAHISDPNELFEKGHKQYEAGNFEAAAETFGTYLKQPKAKKAEDATFFRGEAYYNLKNYKKAITEYSKFPEKFTRSKYMATVLYKIGLSFEALGMKSEAKDFYQELVEKFKKSPEAKRAKAKLK